MCCGLSKPENNEIKQMIHEEAFKKRPRAWQPLSETRGISSWIIWVLLLCWRDHHFEQMSENIYRVYLECIIILLNEIER